MYDSAMLRGQERNLPLLSRPHEIARLRAVDEQVQFDAFVRQSRPLYERIWARKVARVRQND